MAGIKAQTDSLLAQFNQQFETSKAELFKRFLQDQDELNKKFEEYALNDTDNDSETRVGSSQQKSTASINSKKPHKNSILKVHNFFDSDNASNSSLDSVTTNADHSDSDKEEVPVHKNTGSSQAPVKRQTAPFQRHDSNSYVVRSSPGQQTVHQKIQNLNDTSTAAKPWLARSRGNPQRRLPQTPTAVDDKPKPWLLKSRNTSAVQQGKVASDKLGHQEKSITNHSDIVKKTRSSSASSRQRVEQEEQQCQPPERRSKLQSRTLGRSESLRYPNRSGAYTPTQEVVEQSKMQLERQADSGFEERSRGGSMRHASEAKPKKLLVKRSVRPMTAVGLRNHERLVSEEGPQKKFIDTDQSRSAPAAARNKQLVSNSNEYSISKDPVGGFSRSNSVRSQSESRQPSGPKFSLLRQSADYDSSRYPKPPKSVSSVSSHRSRTPHSPATEESTLSLLHRTRSSELINSGLATPEMNRKYGCKKPIDTHRNSSRDSIYNVTETSIKKARSCGNFPVPGTKVSLLKLPKISAERQNSRDRSGTSLGYYVSNETVV